MRDLFLAGTALVWLAAPANSSPRNHAVADRRDAEIAELKAEVDALKQRLDAQEAAQRATAEQVEAAEATATAAQSQAAALAQSHATPTQVAAGASVPVSPPPAKSSASDWWSSTTIGGRSFFNVSSIHQTSTDLAGNRTESAQNGTQTELKRFYMIVDHKFDDVFSANLTTDFRYNTNGTSKDTAVFVKKAYLQAKLSPAFFVRVGEADLAWAPYVESLYGYRFVENTLIDRTRFGTTTEWGVHIGGTFGDGLVSYAASAVNGAGYKTLARVSDTIDLEGRINVNLVKSISIGVGGYIGKLGKSAANLLDADTPHTAGRFDAAAAYTDKRVRLGVEYFAASNWNNVTTAARDKSDGWSAFGSFAFTPKVGVFGRYDWLSPSKEINPAMRDNYFNLGLDYKPISPLDLALVYKHERTKKGLLSTSNGTIGGPDFGSDDEIGLFGQLTF
jgi:hypothetical protein